MKRLIVSTTLFFCFVSLQAQETFWGKVNRFLTKPAVVDSSRIYQPNPGFSLGLFTTGQKAGFDVGVDFDLELDETHSLKGISTYGLRESLCKKIGLEVGYGNVVLGYGLEVGPRSAEKKSAFAFNILGKSWGVRLNYFKISNPFVSGIVFLTKMVRFPLKTSSSQKKKHHCEAFPSMAITSSTTSVSPFRLPTRRVWCNAARQVLGC